MFCIEGSIDCGSTCVPALRECHPNASTLKQRVKDQVILLLLRLTHLTVKLVIFDLLFLAARLGGWQQKHHSEDTSACHGCVLF